MTNLPTSSTSPEHGQVAVTGKCLEHGKWTRHCWPKEAPLLAGMCPSCENVAPAMPRVKFDMEILTGTCEIHGDWSNSVPLVAAKRMVGRCPKCDEATIASERAQAEGVVLAGRGDRRSRMLGDLTEKAGIPRRFRDRSFANYRTGEEGQPPVAAMVEALERIQRYADHFDKVMQRGASLILCGRPGTGKTHLACAVGNSIIQRFGSTVVFASVYEVIQRLKSTFRNDKETEEAVMRHFVEVDLLILDEVGVQLGTAFEEVMLTEIINRRYSDMRPTLILSNLDEQGLAKYLGERVIDRMKEGGGGTIAFQWPSYRAKVLKDKELPTGDAYVAPDWLL